MRGVVAGEVIFQDAGRANRANITFGATASGGSSGAGQAHNALRPGTAYVTLIAFSAFRPGVSRRANTSHITLWPHWATGNTVCAIASIIAFDALQSGFAAHSGVALPTLNSRRSVVAFVAFNAAQTHAARVAFIALLATQSGVAALTRYATLTLYATFTRH